MTRLLIIADDLTGALDSASGFAARGLPVRVALTLDQLGAALADPALTVITYPTGTRELPQAQAAQVLAALTPALQGFDGILFKKIDSRLKGHVAVELLAIRAVSSARPLLASPAIPRLGRFVRDGAVCGFGIDRPIPVAPHLGCDALIPDAASDADLDAALPTDLTATLYVGAAGLAEALARRLSPHPMQPINRLPLPALLAIGSRDPVTLAQIAAAPLTPRPAPNGDVPALTRSPITLIHLTQGQVPLDSATAADRFATGIAAAMLRHPPRTLFACGGETAHAAMRRFGITALDLLGEVLPGVPVARCVTSGLMVATKSGGFGPPSLLTYLVNKFANLGEIGVDSA